VVQSATEWSAAHLEREPGSVAAEIADTLRARLQVPGTVVHASAHRWRYARVASGVPVSCLFAPTAALGAAGDFAQGPQGAHADVEAAWLSGVALAGRVLAG
jgi:predicted NAD/FAD-dependent oxidoreductase